jgi:hypothetical protein
MISIEFSSTAVTRGKQLPNAFDIWGHNSDTENSSVMGYDAVYIGKYLTMLRKNLFSPPSRWFKKSVDLSETGSSKIL